MRKYFICFLLLGIIPALTFADVPIDPHHNKLIMQVVQDEFILDHANVHSVNLHFNPAGQYDGIDVKLKAPAADRMERMTRDGISKRMNIVFNDRIISSVVIVAALKQEIIITGISREDASDFMVMLRDYKPEEPK